ncbi:MAG: hypothetical protein N0E55_15535 [Candidatus Thiodiazotropha taylori]|nr:hypothetical protein [Candidatus Thiodiazotropha taylori]RLW53311.1 MAG: hypothetical protein B6D76_12110 [gamma proteobacterium symbiont of Stewartia floridana]MCG7895675.1 hypothetical protein [Candidatus Thiodiazotropha taylori]MCG7936064.1 hypothetical protein [Candidatus Thiodiazotropha taylori]MCG7942638.1 hypothetical protein [Candidatus Thiodiazotropha taylori]
MKINHLNLLNWSWCLPQSLLGLGWYLLITRLLDRGAQKVNRWDGLLVIRYQRLSGGVSLGPFLFFHASVAGYEMLYHEYGHYRQSMLLGPLYLPLIGVPSLGWALVKKAGLFQQTPYSAFPTERWAEHLAQSCVRLEN